MKCPHCGYEKSLLHRGRDQADGSTRRWRECRSCGRPFQTLEVAIPVDGSPAPALAMAPAPPEAEAPALALVPDPPAKRRRAAGSFWPVTPDQAGDDFHRLPEDLQTDFLSWWNEARRSKWGSKATWTEGAFQLSLGRVCTLALGLKDLTRARQLVEGGVEHGWQALKREYLSGADPLTDISPGNGGPTPKDPAMRSALDPPWQVTAS
jgi:hypothetical protein